MLKRGLRLCLAIFLLGLSLFVVTVVRTNSVPRIMNFGNEEEDATSGWVLYPDFLMFDRDFSVNIRANNTVTVYILDEAAIKMWNADKTVDAVWACEDVVEAVFSERSVGRGGYAVLVYLPDDDITVIKVALTFSGFEKDLLLLSLTIIGVGILLIIALLSIKLRSKKSQTTLF